MSICERMSVLRAHFHQSVSGFSLMRIDSDSLMWVDFSKVWIDSVSLMWVDFSKVKSRLASICERMSVLCGRFLSI